MGWRFRRSIKIAPGVRWNFGKGSTSVSVGPRGAKLTVGTSGARASAGIPGTGVSFSQTLGTPTVSSSQSGYIPGSGSTASAAEVSVPTDQNPDRFNLPASHKSKVLLGNWRWVRSHVGLPRQRAPARSENWGGRTPELVGWTVHVDYRDRRPRRCADAKPCRQVPA
jgi:hypothetical protein